MGDPISLQQVRHLLAARLPRSRMGFAVRAPAAMVPTGVRRLDLALGGGLPQGETTELVGEGGGSGSAQVLHAVLRRAAADGRLVALIDGADSLDVDALEPVELARLFWVRCRTVSEALAAADLLLRDRNFPLLILDLKLNPAAEWRRVSGGVWSRFDRLREQHRTTLLVVTARPTVSGAARRVQVKPERSGRPGSLGAGHTEQAPREVLEQLEFTLLREMSGRGGGDTDASVPSAAPLGERWALTG